MNNLTMLASWLFETLAGRIGSFIIASRIFTLGFCFSAWGDPGNHLKPTCLDCNRAFLPLFAELLQRV